MCMFEFWWQVALAVAALCIVACIACRLGVIDKTLLVIS